MKVEALNKCLRGELSALETYTQALEKIGQQNADQGKFQRLSRIRDDHEQAAAQVRTLIEQMGDRPSQDSGAWGTWSKAVMGTAKLFSDKAALKALKEGEASGVEDYPSVAEDPDAPAGVKQAVVPLLDRNREHIRVLDTLMETA